MKWLVQEFLNDNSNSTRMIDALDACLVDYLIIRLNRDNTFTVIDKEHKTPQVDSETLLREFVSGEHVMVYGSKTFANVTRSINLNPGSFMNDQFEFEVFKEKLGDELLNCEFIVGELANLHPTWDTFFIRPTGNTKLFTGTVVTKESFRLWQKQQSGKDSPYIGHTLMVSSVQEIEEEYRFFIVNQKIVTGSSYQVNKVPNTTRKPSDELLEYTQRMVDLFPLAPVFVIDIAKTNDGFKVVEYNNMNSSGLYGCNEILIVQALNDLLS